MRSGAGTRCTLRLRSRIRMNQTILVAVVMVIYATVGIMYAYERNWPWALTWLSYAAANVGLIWAAKS